VSASYAPLVSNVRMSDYGYWVVDVNVAPGKTMSVMIAVTGITPEQAASHALAGLPEITPGGTPWPSPGS
jgi:hypothetical protein